MSEHELPLPDYDQLPFGALRHRIRALSGDEIQALLEHEHAHGNRTPVVKLLTERQEQLAQGAQPSGGSQEEMPEIATHKQAGSPVTPEAPTAPGRPTAHGTTGRRGKGIEHSE